GLCFCVPHAKRAAIRKRRRPFSKPCTCCNPDSRRLAARALRRQPVNQCTCGGVSPQYRCIAIEPVRHFTHAVAVVIVFCKQHVQQRSFSQVVPLFEEGLAHLIGLGGESFVLLSTTEHGVRILI